MKEKLTIVAPKNMKTKNGFIINPQTLQPATPEEVEKLVKNRI